MHPELACVRCVQAQELGKRREARDAPPLGVQRVAGWRDTVACARDCTSPDPRCSGSRTLQQSKTLVPPPLRSVELLHTRPANPGPTLATASCGLHGARSGDTQIEIAGRPSPPQRFGAPPRPSGRPPARALFRGWLIVASRHVVGHVRLPDAKMLPSNYSTGQHSSDGDDMASWLNHGPRIAPGRPLSRDRTPGRTM